MRGIDPAGMILGALLFGVICISFAHADAPSFADQRLACLRVTGNPEKYTGREIETCTKWIARLNDQLDADSIAWTKQVVHAMEVEP